MSLNNGFEHDRGHVLHHSNIEYPKRYYYDVTDKVFEKASRYEDRKQEKDKSHEKKSVLEKLEEKKDEAKATVGAKKTSYRDAVSL